MSLLEAVVSGGCLDTFDDVPAFPDFMMFLFGGIGKVCTVVAKV